MKTVKYLLVFFFLAFLPIFAQDQTNPEITVEELYAHIKYLASEECEGRKPGTDGGILASDYIKSQLKLSNLIFPYENGFQNFDISTSVELGEKNSFLFNEKSCTLNEDFIPLTISESGVYEFDIAFVGYGFDFQNDTMVWNDYNEIDVSGRWAIIFLGSPEYKSKNDPFQNYSGIRKKIMVAKDHGATGVIFISGKKYNPNDELTSLSFGKKESTTGLPVIHVKREVADLILADLRTNIDILEEEINNTMVPSSFTYEQKVKAEIDLVRVKSQARNVVALLEGNDPMLKNEYIVIGAHYDHLGWGGEGSGSRKPDTNAIHYGADDNASGVAATIELIEKFSSKKENKRSLLFIAFDGEEMGLLGSKYFINNSLVELDKVKFMFNLDMVGRLNPDTKGITIGGTGTAYGLEELLKEVAKGTELNIKFSPEGFGPSDHASFYTNNIPVLFFFTGVTLDYHTPADSPEKINQDGHKEVTEFVYSVLLKICNTDEEIQFIEAGSNQSQDTKRSFKVTLGIMPDIAGGNIKGLKVDGITRGKPADVAGILKGDIITAIDGKPVNDIYEYMNRLSDFEPGDQITVEVLRNNEKIVLIVML
ncbi:MAG: M20/M25/M40 family metallo-hydrolase [Ignavibacteriales bacterium]|nr:M20/M25/M40 family metallo-hydrolase [Ignavibacteriales bacterium]